MRRTVGAQPVVEVVGTVAARAQELGQAFSRAIRDGRRTTRVPAAALAGLPEDYLAEHPADADGLVGTPVAAR